MDSVPDSAACNEAVKLAVKHGFSGLKGFVNGVMRNIARNREHIVWPDMQKEPKLALSVKYSMPEWLVERFMEQFGTQRCVHILEAFLEKRPTSVRVDTGIRPVEQVAESLKQQGITVQRDENLPYALLLSGYDTLDEIPEFEEGLLYVQDTASMMVVEYADPKPGDFVLDVCAAPGGKSIHAASKLSGTGMVEARDLTEYKVEMIRDNIERCQVPNMRAKCHDALVFDEQMKQKADLVIADLPCSGLGVIGTKTDIKYNASEEKIRELAKLQRQILDVVHYYVKPGGTLMYSTCTITTEENQENVAYFTEKYPEFELEMMRQFLPDEGCDGFFIAKLHRKNETT
jgi:16S rRNA (cytosine967-C5)-methyltransferase